MREKELAAVAEDRENNPDLEFMKEQYSAKDKDFLERNGRLFFLAFIRPIINGYIIDKILMDYLPVSNTNK